MKSIPIKRASIDQRCGDCLHFNRTAKFNDLCSKLGRKAYAQAPGCFAPDVFLLAKKAPTALYNLGLLLESFDHKESRVLLSLIQDHKLLEKNTGLKFGQPVYFRLSSSDYLSNYYRGFVMGIAEGNNVYVTSDLNKTQRTSPVIASLQRDSILSTREFKKHKEKLTTQARVLDPKPIFAATKKQSILKQENYIPPSLDSAPKEWFDKKKIKKVRSSRSKPIDGKLEFSV